MSAANSASQPVRRVAPPAARPSAQPPKVGFAPADTGAEFKLNLADIPRARESLDVEGFKPSLLSRLFELLAPIKSK